MMYIGTSLGGCLTSMLQGQVSIDQVLFIVTRTNAPTFERFIDVVKLYHTEGDRYGSSNLFFDYNLSKFNLDDCLYLAEQLWYQGKIHQPRTFVSSYSYEHPEMLHGELWIEVVPTLKNKTPAVVDAYNKYKMLDQLTK